MQTNVSISIHPAVGQTVHLFHLIRTREEIFKFPIYRNNHQTCTPSHTLKAFLTTLD